MESRIRIALNSKIIKSVAKFDISIFGENSLSVCEKKEDNYQVRRLCDNKILCVGDSEKYKDASTRVMYTGVKFGTGDFGDKKIEMIY